MLYTNQALVQDFLGRQLTEHESNILSTIVIAVERQIDKKLDTTFKNTATLLATARYFDGGNRHIDVTPVQNITAIELLDSAGTVIETLDSDNYVLRPKGAAVTRSLDMRWGKICRGYASIKITGDFTEYGAEEIGVPSDIQIIATRVAGSMLAQAESTSAGLKSETTEGHQVVFNGGTGDPFKDDKVVSRLMEERTEILVDDTISPYNSGYDDGYRGY